MPHPPLNLPSNLALSFRIRMSRRILLDYALGRAGLEYQSNTAAYITGTKIPSSPSQGNHTEKIELPMSIYTP